MENEKDTDVRSLFIDDLNSLIELTVRNEPLQLRHIRQASVILRRWLCNNDLSKLYKNPPRPRITLPVLDDYHIFEKLPLDKDMVYYISAGTSFNKTPLWALHHSLAPEPPEWFVKLPPLSHKQVKPSIAMNKPMLYFENNTFRMNEVLSFACNKLGGAHYDWQRNIRQQKLEDASKYISFGGHPDHIESGDVGELHIFLEPDSNQSLSGVMVVVIVASAMLLNIQLDGDFLLEKHLKD